jgi:hypothetical protein
MSCWLQGMQLYLQLSSQLQDVTSFAGTTISSAMQLGRKKQELEKVKLD